ncbi:MAG: hypothetical protein IJ856_05195 [Candidatus Methanomethylophilaceae archaeon]|nr:hypothetical protein [Candidatus Methanomethylophilaceae archaeon]
MSGQGVSLSRDPWVRRAVLVIVAGILVRLALSPFLTYDLEIYHWGVVMENIQSGNGLYGLAGYYYTPVWGYLLAALSGFQDAFLSIGTFGIRFTDLLGIEDLVCRYHTATAVTIGFVMALKVPLILTDAAVGVLSFFFVRSISGDGRKAFFASVLWIFFPVAVYMSGVQVQFDSVSALLMLLTVFLVMRGHSLLGGAVFSAAVLLKFYPAVCLPVLVAYLFVRYRSDGRFGGELSKAVVGAGASAAVLLLPQILGGDLSDAFSFITGRVSDGDALMTITSFLSMAAMLAGFVVCGYRMYRCGEDPEKALVVNCLLALSFATVFSFVPQYILVAVPFLCVAATCFDGRYMTCWWMVGIGNLFAAVAINNFSLFASSSEFLGMASPEWVVSAMEAMESLTVAGFTSVEILDAAGCVFGALGIILILVIGLEDVIPSERLRGRIGNLWRWECGQE